MKKIAYERRGAGPKERGAHNVGVMLEANEYACVKSTAERERVTVSDVIRGALAYAGVTAPLGTGTAPTNGNGASK